MQTMPKERARDAVPANRRDRASSVRSEAAVCGDYGAVISRRVASAFLLPVSVGPAFVRLRMQQESLRKEKMVLSL